MSLWGNSDNKASVGTVTLDYSTGTVTSAVGAANSTKFGDAGSAAVGDVIRFGLKGGTGVYFGDAVITGITSHRVCTIGSTAGLSGAAIAATSFYVSQLPKYTVLDSQLGQKADIGSDRTTYGISTSMGYGSFAASEQGWVGVTTYVDCNSNLRVKSETLVAMSGIVTGANGLLYPTND